MKKILVIGQTPPPFGGQALMIRRLLKGSYSNAQLYHVNMSFSRDMDEMGRWRWGKLVQPFFIILKTTYLRIRHKIEVLYYPPSGPDLLPVLRDMAILLCTRWMFHKTIFHFHAAGISELYEKLPSYLKLLYRWSYSKPDLAIRLSSFNPDDGDFLHAQEMCVVPNGIEDDYLAMGLPTKQEHNVCNLLYVGLVSESKGILVLLDSIKIVKDHGICVNVSVVGKFASDDFKRLVIERIADYGLGDIFSFKGVLTGLDKHKQFLDADIFCFPSFFESESFGLVVVEAMQFGVPVIITKWRGVQSLITDGEEGFLVPAHDVDTLAEKIVTLATDLVLRTKMGCKGRERYLREYTIDKFYQRMDECFSKV